MTFLPLALLISLLTGAAVFFISQIIITWFFYLGSHWLEVIDSVKYPAWWYKIARGEYITKHSATAGLSPAWSVHRLLVAKLLLCLLTVLLASVLYITTPSWYLPLALVIAGYTGVDACIGYLSRRRASYALKTFAHCLDSLKLQGAIGLNIEASIHNLAHIKTGLWGREFSKVSFELNHGLPIEDTLERFANRFQGTDLKRFASAIAQAKKLGVSLADTLNLQSEQLRTCRRQRAEEKARLAAVKISFPLVFFIFPALLIIYLAPAVIKVMQLQ